MEGFAREAQAAAGEAGVGGMRRDGFHRALTTDGEAMGIDAPPIGFRAAADGGAGVEGEADEDRVGMAVREEDAVIEIDEAVVGAQHDGAEGTTQFVAQPEGEVEVRVLFLLAGVAADCSGVVAAVARVDDHRPETFRPRAVSPVVQAARRGTGRGAGIEGDREGGDEKGREKAHGEKSQTLKPKLQGRRGVSIFSTFRKNASKSPPDSLMSFRKVSVSLL
jgi:hypothetical protein